MEVQLLLVRLEAIAIVGRIVRLLKITIILIWNPQLRFETNLINTSAFTLVAPKVRKGNRFTEQGWENDIDKQGRGNPATSLVC